MYYVTSSISVLPDEAWPGVIMLRECAIRAAQILFNELICSSQGQGRNHVFKVGGPIPWSRVLLPFHRKKLDRCTQFGAVGYIITLYSSKSYVKSWGSVEILGKSGLPDSPVVVPMLGAEFS